MKKINLFVTALLLAVIALPSAAFAYNGGEREDSHNSFFKAGIQAQANFRADRDNKFDNKWSKDYRNNWYAGTITALSTPNFTLQTSTGTVYTVNTSNAKLTRAFDRTIAFADLKIGDKIWVKGNLSGSTVTASLVYDQEINKRPAVAKGTVTAVSGNTITLETKRKGTVTVTTDSNTEVKQNGKVVPSSTISVGSTIKVKGMWDKVLEQLHAFRIKIK